MTGRGGAVDPPPLPRVAPLGVQLRIEPAGALECWETTYPDLLVNEAGRLVAKVP